MKTIEITYDTATGERTVDLKGFAGQGCKAVAAAFAHGDKAKVSHEKPEIRQRVAEGAREAQRG